MKCKWGSCEESWSFTYGIDAGLKSRRDLLLFIYLFIYLSISFLSKSIPKGSCLRNFGDAIIHDIAAMTILLQTLKHRWELSFSPRSTTAQCRDCPSFNTYGNNNNKNSQANINSKQRRSQWDYTRPLDSWRCWRNSYLSRQEVRSSIGC